MKFDALAREYATLWDGMQITRLESSIKSTAARIVARRADYERIQALTNVPWYVIGVIHAMETGLRFDRHLHNGDPLTKPTKLVPKFRPPGPGPFTFEESCCDALKMKDYHKITDWPIERIAWALENYNGWGYRRYHSDVLSPYLWSGTNHYRSGKYVADGKWSLTAVSSQSGAMALLRVIDDLCPDVTLRSMYEADAKNPEDLSPASNSKTDTGGMTPVQKAGAATTFLTAAGTAYTYLPVIDPAAATATIAAWQGLGRAVTDAGSFIAGLGKIGPLVVAGGFAFFAARWAINRWGPA